jgi:hypothetical protein
MEWAELVECLSSAGVEPAEVWQAVTSCIEVPEPADPDPAQLELF